MEAVFAFFIRDISDDAGTFCVHAAEAIGSNFFRWSRVDAEMITVLVAPSIRFFPSSS